MKKYILSNLIFLVLILNCFSQSGWQWVNPNPLHTKIVSIRFINVQVGYLGSEDGYLLKTTNAGENFSTVRMGTESISSIFFINDFTGYITIGRNVLKTTNQGQNWTSHNLDSTLNDVYFPSLNTGYISSKSGILYKTTNSGANWFIINTGYNTINLGKLWFTDNNNGYMIRSFENRENRLFKTTDGGYNWEAFSFPEYSTTVTDICFVDSNNGFASTDNHTYQVGSIVYKTTNAGCNWFVSYANPIIQFGSSSSLNFINKDTGYVGMEGAFLRTFDGLNWSIFCSSPYSGYGNFRFLNLNTGISANNEILKTTNSGTNWISKRWTLTNNGLNSIYFVNPSTGFIAGDSGVILRTTNTGYNWNIYFCGYKKKLRSTLFLNSQTGYIVGDAGLLIKSTNGGLSWISCTSGVVKNLNYIYSKNPGIVYIAGDSGTILKSTDSGVSWNRQISGRPEHLRVINFIDENTGFAGGDYGYNSGFVLKTTNSGSVWNYSTIPSGANTYIKFFDSNTGFIGGENIVKTTNCGVNWVMVSSIPVSNIYFQDINTGYCNSNNSILITTNGGVDWTSQDVSLRQFSVRDIKFLDFSTGFVVGTKGVILCTYTGGFSSIEHNKSILLPDKLSLSQNYPNPFNPVTKINYELPENGMVKLVIYDILGREIKTLINELKQAGKYMVEFDGNQFASGVYFYRIQVEGRNSYTDVKKMLLIK
jgi:photosystem II stability/assembly factor-like uncharacterized protein